MHQAETSKADVRAVKGDYQPTKAELEADISIDATPEVVARALVRTVPTNPQTAKAGTPMNFPIPLASSQGLYLKLR